jgi:hypothetical protein
LAWETPIPYPHRITSKIIVFVFTFAMHVQNLIPRTVSDKRRADPSSLQKYSYSIQ